MTIALQNKKETTVFNEQQVQLIKNYICKDISDDEMKLFGAVCQKTGLDPFMKQIYAVKRSGVMTIQTSIDGYRLIAERTGRYAPGRESTFTYNGEKMISATSYVKKQTVDGTWHEVAASAYFEEYKPAYKNQFWDSKPHIMLAKCAEALALRKAFPNELSGLYSEEEMHQASNPIKPLVSDQQFQELKNLFDKCSPEFQVKMEDYLNSKGISSLNLVPQECFKPIFDRLKAKSDEYEHQIKQEGAA